MFSQTNQSNTQQSLFTTAGAAIKPTTLGAQKTGFTSNISRQSRPMAVKPVMSAAANKGQFYQFSK